MKIKSPKDSVGLMFLGFGLSLSSGRHLYQMGSAVRMGPAIFPGPARWPVAFPRLVILLDLRRRRVAGSAFASGR